MYVMAGRRDQYAAYLQKHKHNSQMRPRDQIRILEWAKINMTSE